MSLQRVFRRQLYLHILEQLLLAVVWKMHSLSRRAKVEIMALTERRKNYREDMKPEDTFAHHFCCHSMRPHQEH